MTFTGPQAAQLRRSLGLPAVATADQIYAALQQRFQTAQATNAATQQTLKAAARLFNIPEDSLLDDPQAATARASGPAESSDDALRAFARGLNIPEDSLLEPKPPSTTPTQFAARAVKPSTRSLAQFARSFGLDPDDLV